MKDLIKKQLIPVTFLPSTVKHGYANGYVGVPEGHPWYGQNYDSIFVDVHGGLTYGDFKCPTMEPDGLYWVGFDVCHYGDNKLNRDEAFCQAEVDSLYQQALAAINEPTT